MKLRLENKVAIITGAGSGQGKEAAKLFADEGAVVVIAEWNEKTGKEVEALLKDKGQEALFIKTDISKEEDCENVINTTVEKYGKIDILFNNASVGYSAIFEHNMNMGSLLTCSLKEWNDVLAINLNGVFLMCKHCIPVMQKQGYGSIVNNSSMNGIIAVPGADAYTAAKGGVVALSRVMAVDYAPEIRVNVICPGGINTPMIAPAIEAAKAGGEMGDLGSDTPLGRLGEPIEVAYTALFLASDEASYITGNIVPVSGGWH